MNPPPPAAATPSPSPEQWRRGSDRPLPVVVPLRAGPVTAELVGCDLRAVVMDGAEIAQRIYIATRDRNWGTLPIDIQTVDVDAREDTFIVRCEVRQHERDIDLTWRSTIRGDRDGTIAWDLTAIPAVSCTYKLFGFNIHHGMADYVGCPYTGEAETGRIEGAFPTTIAPQPVIDRTEVPIFPPVRSLSVMLGHGVGAHFTFEGDLFECEDQRNWTDASFKSQSFPPRRNGFFTTEAGRKIRQRITIAPFRHARTPSPLLASGPTPLPAGTLMPGIGLVAASHGHPLDPVEAAQIAVLRPDHLLGELDLAHPGWPAVLTQHASDAAAVDCNLALAVVLSPGDEPHQLAGLASRLPAPVSRIGVFHHAEECTDPAWIDHLRALLGARAAAITFVGGTRTDFCELNRHRHHHLGRDRDGIAWAISPQVHAADDRSLVENLPGIGETARTARSFAGERPLFPGPITLKPRLNPSATEAVTPVSAIPDALPPEIDPRQMSLLGAGWTLGAIVQLATAGVASISLFETTGWRGVIQGIRPSPIPDRFPAQPGMVFPLYHVLADLAEMPHATVTMAECKAIAVLGLRTAARHMILMANLTPDDRPCPTTAWPLPDGTSPIIRRLSSTTVRHACIDPAGFRARGDRPPLADLRLSPYEVATAIVETSACPTKTLDHVEAAEGTAEGRERQVDVHPRLGANGEPTRAIG